MVAGIEDGKAGITLGVMSEEVVSTAIYIAVCVRSSDEVARSSDVSDV